jgi:hypothetical protein
VLYLPLSIVSQAVGVLHDRVAEGPGVAVVLLRSRAAVRAPALEKRTTSCIKRPDYVFVFETHVVILEVDESYHRFYAVTCEVDRIGKLKDLVQLPLHVVRFNPAKGRYVLLKDMLRQLFVSPEGALNAAGVLVHFVGYSDDRIEELNNENEFCYEYKKVACLV